MAADSSAEIPTNFEWRPPYHYSTPCGIEAGLRGPLCQHLRLISSSHTIRAGAWLDLFRVNFPAVTAERLFHFFFILGLIRPAIVPARSELGIGTRSTDALDRNVAQPLCYSQEWHFNAHVSQRARSFRRPPQSFGDKKRSSFRCLRPDCRRGRLALQIACPCMEESSHRPFSKRHFPCYDAGLAECGGNALSPTPHSAGCCPQRTASVCRRCPS